MEKCAIFGVKVIKKAARNAGCDGELMLGQLDEVVRECICVRQNEEYVPVYILSEKFLCRKLRGENDPSNDSRDN